MMSDAEVGKTTAEDRLGMDEEQWARFQAYTRGFGEQDAYGIDVSLLRANLRLAPGERIYKMLEGLALLGRNAVSDLQTGWSSLLLSLHRHQVRFVLIGGVAMRLHGAAHLTDDVDLLYARDLDNLRALAEALAPLHPRLRGADPDLPFRWDLRTLRAGLNFTFDTDAGAVDLLGEVPGIDSFEGVWERADEMELLGTTVRIASLPDLIAMKRAAGRPKDELHLRELERLRALLEIGEKGDA
jgi:predicted nucleotidyltransferase